MCQCIRTVLIASLEAIFIATITCYFPDETSSGVASLAGSENSSEAWDMDQYNMNPLQEVQDANNAKEADDNNSKSNDTESIMSELPTDTGYRETEEKAPNLNFKTVSDHSNLFEDEVSRFIRLLGVKGGERSVEESVVCCGSVSVFRDALVDNSRNVRGGVRVSREDSLAEKMRRDNCVCFG